MVKERYLITGAATGFGKGIAFGLAELGKEVIAGVETLSEVSALLKEAEEKGVALQVEKLDVTDPADRERAWEWDIDVLLNNAGIKEGGSLVDIPEERLRNQFEINVFGPILLTKGIAKNMVKKQRGKIIFMSSISGLQADPFSGPYCGSKFTVEAFAESLSKELQEFNVAVATINPGPYLTGFNDREYETWRMWRDNPAERVFNYDELAFPYEQFDPQPVIAESIKVLTGEVTKYRNTIPKGMEALIKKGQKDKWNQEYDENLGERHEMVQKAMDIDPATTVPEGIIDKLKDKM